MDDYEDGYNDEDDYEYEYEYDYEEYDEDFRTIDPITNFAKSRRSTSTTADTSNIHANSLLEYNDPMSSIDSNPATKECILSSSDDSLQANIISESVI